MHPAVTGKPFSVKLTGGTDGDVAGNMILQLAKRCAASTTHTLCVHLNETRMMSPSHHINPIRYPG